MFFLNAATNKVVKVIAHLLSHLPAKFRYRIIFMDLTSLLFSNTFNTYFPFLRWSMLKYIFSSFIGVLVWSSIWYQLLYKSKWKFIFSKYIVAIIFTITVVVLLAGSAFAVSYAVFGRGDLIVYNNGLSFFDSGAALYRLIWAFISGTVSMVFFSVRFCSLRAPGYLSPVFKARWCFLLGGKTHRWLGVYFTK